MTTVAAFAAHHSSAPAAAVHGDHVAFGILAVLALVAAALTPTLKAHRVQAEEAPAGELAFEEAA
jgi:hypothetical protein